jgi:integrase
MMPEDTAPKQKRGKARERGNGQGTVYKYGKTRYRWIFRKDGEIRATGIEANKTAAEKALSKAITDYERGTLTTMSRTTVREFSETWMTRHKGKEQNTLDKYQRELNYILEHIGGVKLKDLKAGHVKDALSKLADKKATKGLGFGRTLASATLAGIRTRIRAVIREAVADGEMSNDVTVSVKRVKVSKTEHPGIALDFDQAARFHEIGDALHMAGMARLWPALFLCVSIGLRRGEVMALQWQDVDFTSSTLTIRRNLTTSSKGVYLKDCAKTEASNRDIFFPASVKAALERQLERVTLEANVLGIKVTPTSPMFPNENGKHSNPNVLARSLACVLGWSDPGLEQRKPNELKTGVRKPEAKRTYHLSGLEFRLRMTRLEHRARLEQVVRSGPVLPRISVHDLRHTAGSLMLMRGVPLETVSDMLGHKDSSITRQTYIHITEKFRRDNVIDLFPALPVRVVQEIAVN